jgi:putative endonuclease
MKRGFKILERNYLRKWGEIDIVARKGKDIRFVEVKSVTHETDDIVSRETYIKAEEHVTREKLERLARAIQTYLADRKVPRETKFQLDVVTVKLNLKDKTARIGIIENVL